jgi:hypothetical protein
MLFMTAAGGLSAARAMVQEVSITPKQVSDRLAAIMRFLCFGDKKDIIVRLLYVVIHECIFPWEALYKAYIGKELGEVHNSVKMICRRLAAEGRKKLAAVDRDSQDVYA